MQILAISVMILMIIGAIAALAMLQIIYFCACKSHVIRYTDFSVICSNNGRWFFVKHTYGKIFGLIRYRGLLYSYNDPNQVYVAKSEQEADNYCNDNLTRYNLGELK